MGQYRAHSARGVLGCCVYMQESTSQPQCVHKESGMPQLHPVCQRIYGVIAYGTLSQLENSAGSKHCQVLRYPVTYLVERMKPSYFETVI